MKWEKQKTEGNEQKTAETASTERGDDRELEGVT